MNSLSEYISRPRQFTINGTPEGGRALALCELFHAADGRSIIHVARDDSSMARLAHALPFFAPNIDLLVFPAWDCLPYDRVSPNTEILSRRLDTLAKLATSTSPVVILTTVSAILQKVPKRDTYANASISGVVGDEIVVEGLLAFLEGNGYTRAGTVREPGEYAVRGDIVDIFPPGANDPVRLDFFGDELEGVRSFDAMTQRTITVLEDFSLCPVSEVTLDEASVARFRSKYRVMFGAGSTEDPICEAIRAGHRFIGMEHWLPLFHDELETLFDYRADAVISMDHEVEVVSKDRFEMIADYYDARVAMLPSVKRDRKATGMQGGDEIYKPIPPDTLFLDEQTWAAYLSARPVAILSAFDAPPTAEDSSGPQNHLDWGGRITLDFT
ncbi:MAG: transcription-repair coupling factor, partial [Alphaproteobacteria bacterium]|nr:transcription-repair coupling factor [Alphaproteobacteria bacterium]